MIYHHTLGPVELYRMNPNYSQNPTTLLERGHLVTHDTLSTAISQLAPNKGLHFIQSVSTHLLST